MTVDGNPFHVPASAPIELVDNDDLEPRAGVMSLGWDPTTAQLVIEAYPLEEVDEDDETDDTEEVLRVRMPVGTARAFASAPAKWWEPDTPSVCVILGQPIAFDGLICTFPQS